MALRRRLICIGAGIALAATGCSSSGDAQPATLAPVTSQVVVISSETSSVVVETTAASVATSDATTVTDPSAAETSASSASVDAPDTSSWPADAQSALTAYMNFNEVTDLAFTDPARDWSAEIYKYAVDPVAFSTIEYLQQPAVQEGRGAGHTSVFPQVREIQPALITFDVCVDSSDFTFTGPNGENLLYPDVQGSYFRHPAVVEVAQYDDGRWLVTTIESNYETKC